MLLRERASEMLHELREQTASNPDVMYLSCEMSNGWIIVVHLPEDNQTYALESEQDFEREVGELSGGGDED